MGFRHSPRNILWIAFPILCTCKWFCFPFCVGFCGKLSKRPGINLYTIESLSAVRFLQSSLPLPFCIHTHLVSLTQYIKESLQAFVDSTFRAHSAGSHAFVNGPSSSPPGCVHWNRACSSTYFFVFSYDALAKHTQWWGRKGQKKEISARWSYSRTPNFSKSLCTDKTRNVQIEKERKITNAVNDQTHSW